MIPIVSSVSKDFKAYFAQIAFEEGIDPRSAVISMDITISGNPIPVNQDDVLIQEDETPKESNDQSKKA